MDTNGAQKNGHELRVIRGGRGRRHSPARSRAELTLDARMVERFKSVLTPDGCVPSRAIQEIREGRQAPWRTTARRVIEMVQEGVPVEVIKAAAVYEMERFVDELVAQPDRAA